MSEQEFDTFYTDDPVCPYCGHVEESANEINFGPTGTTAIDCAKCGLDFECSQEFSVSYISSKIKEAK